MPECVFSALREETHICRALLRLSLRRQHRLELDHARGQVLNLCLLLSNRGALFLVGFLLLIDSLPLPLDFTQEHGVDEVVAHRFRGAVLVEDNEFWSHLRDLLGNQPVLARLGVVKFRLVVERYRPQFHQHVALGADVGNLVLIAERRLDRAELTRGVDKDFHAVGAGLSGDPSDIRRSDGSDVADADGIRLASYAAVADVDIIAFGRLEIAPTPVPMATFPLPLVRLASAADPRATLLAPIVLAVSALKPKAELPPAVVLARRAKLPKAELPPVVVDVPPVVFW